MQMADADIKKFPKMAYYVRVNVPDVIKVPSIVRAFEKIGGINKTTLRGALTWASGPSIKVTKLVDAFGEFSPGVGSQEIRVDTGVVTEFEAGKGVRVARAGNVFLLGVTLLHELMHWADDQDGVQRADEEGITFEREVYGKVIV